MTPAEFGKLSEVFDKLRDLGHMDILGGCNESIRDNGREMADEFGVPYLSVLMWFEERLNPPTITPDDIVEWINWTEGNGQPRAKKRKGAK